jgi:hypothetical protein
MIKILLSDWLTYVYLVWVAVLIVGLFFGKRRTSRDMPPQSRR